MLGEVGLNNVVHFDCNVRVTPDHSLTGRIEYIFKEAFLQVDAIACVRFVFAPRCYVPV